MKLADYLHQQGISDSAFGDLIGTTQAAVTRYAAGQRIPRPDIMSRIAEATQSKVTANDFHSAEAPQHARIARKSLPAEAVA